jgi:hypothetical protein
MEPRNVPGERHDTGTLDLAATLLVMQAAFGLVSAVGLVVLSFFVGASPLTGLALLVAVGVPLLAIIAARAITRQRRWARNVVIVYELVVLLGAVFRLIIDGSVALSLVVTMTSMLVPASVMVLVLSPSARRAVAGARRRKAQDTPIELPETVPLRPAA